jgi:RND family efflux transporter MFP subunit
MRSPIEGVVWRRRLDPGALVGPSGQPILTLVRTDVLRVFVPVREREAAGVSVGQAAYVELDALPGQRIEGRVVRLAPAFDPGTRTVDAEVHLDNRAGALKPGMYGRGAIVLATHRGAPVVPASAVQAGEKGARLFVLEGGRAKQRQVVLGVDGGEWLEVTAGVSPGDEVLVAGADAIADGAAVRPVRAPRRPEAPPRPPGSPG